MSTLLEEAAWLAKSAGLRALSDLAAIRVRGDDALSWLNGQITNDVRKLSGDMSVRALVVAVKGKLLAEVRTFMHEGTPLVLVSKSALADVLAQFEKYIVMEDVEVSIEPWSILTVQGARSSEAVHSAGIPGVVCDRLGSGGVDIVTNESTYAQTYAELVRGAQNVGGGAVTEEAWELARIRASIGEFGRDFGPTNYAQEAGLGGSSVSFNKGCYIGQEVVCMLESRGQIQKRLVSLELEGSEIPPVGAEIFTDGKPIGLVTSTVADPELGKILAMGYVKRAHSEVGTVLDLCHRNAVIRAWAR